MPLDSSFQIVSDSDDPQPWTLVVQAPATAMHTVAILVTTLRLLYRWHLSRSSWEDTWAALALICDAGSLAGIWMPVAPTNQHRTPPINHASDWLLSLTMTSVVWFARMSILFSVVRIANPTRKLRLVVYCTGAVFIATDAALLGQKAYNCTMKNCWVDTSVAVAQLTTDIISDIILVAVPIRFLRDVRLDRDRRTLIISAFSASLLITAVTILQSILLFQDVTDVTLVIGHFRAALALFVCNALVLVTFVYRLCHKSGADLEDSAAKGCMNSSDAAQFTSVIYPPSRLSSFAYHVTSGHGRGDVTHTEVVNPPYQHDPSILLGVAGDPKSDCEGKDIGGE